MAGAFAAGPATADKHELTRRLADRRYINVKELNREQVYAFVDKAGPTLVAGSGYTRGFSGVTRPETGTYCLAGKAGVSVSKRTLVATPEWGRSTGPENNFVVMIAAGNPDCPGNQAQVITYRLSQTQGQPVDADLTNDVSFMVVAPA